MSGLVTAYRRPFTVTFPRLLPSLAMALGLAPLGELPRARSVAQSRSLLSTDPNPPLACTQFRRIRPELADHLPDAVLESDRPDTGRWSHLGDAAAQPDLSVSSEPTITPANPRADLAAPLSDLATFEVAPVPTVRVQSPQELIDTLNSAFIGIVIIPKDVKWDLSGQFQLPLKTGVSLVGERGELCSRPLLFTNTQSVEQIWLFDISSNNVRVEGIHFRGPSNGSRSMDQQYFHALLVRINRTDGTGRGIFINDNEFDQWPGAGVEVTSAHCARTPEQYDPAWPLPTHADAQQVRIERNYFHHNARDDGGYGVDVPCGAYAAITGNLFDFNRHAVASNGFAHTGYIARFNYVLQGGFLQDQFYNQQFDVHGTNDSDGDNISTGYGGTAGEFYEIALNTIRGEQTYFGGTKTRPALMLRGKPTEGLLFTANVVVHNSADAAVALKNDKGDTGLDEEDADFNYTGAGNSYNTDYSSELAAGDFDGDHRTDVFLANGTAWWVSRGGSEPWAFLHASTKRTKELGFADINNDGVTDVLYRDGAGNLGYLRSGAGDLIPLTTSPVAIGDLRYGDFDGDRKTDIFRRESNGRWVIWFGSTKTWTLAERSSYGINELRFGEFDSVPGTDVLVALSNEWAVSSGAVKKWAHLNRRLRSSLKKALVADFDGDKRDDLAFDNGEQFWVFSPGGRGPLQSLRDADGFTKYKPLDKLLPGHFDGSPEASIITYGDVVLTLHSSAEDHFLIWHRGVGRDPLAQISREAMR